MIALCSVTWAWFSEGVTSPENKIQAGYCTVTVSVTDGESSVAPHTDSPLRYTLEAGKSYHITITSSGTVRSSYCKLAVNGQDYYTEQISTAKPDNTISFTLEFDVSTTVEFCTRWGTYHVDNTARDLYNGKQYLNLIEIPSA